MLGEPTGYYNIWASIFGLILLFGVPLFIAYRFTHAGKDKIKIINKASLRLDAKIAYVRTTRKGTKGSKYYSTTVYFEDGFELIANDTIRKNQFLMYSISITPEMQQAIVERAIIAHRDACIAYQTKQK